MHRSKVTLFVLAVVLIQATACIPYSLASTAQTVPVGQSRTTTTTWFMPNGVGLRDDSTTPRHTLIGFDGETRWGIDDESDFGLRVPSGSGIVATYKRRFAGYAHPDSAAFAWELGGGLVNLGEHALGQFSLIASGPKRGGAVWYGAARIIQVTPLSEGAVHDEPTIGGLLGARISIGGGEILPELAVYHDRSALHIRTSDVIFVPSMSLRGLRLPGFGGMGPFGRW